MSTPLPLSDEEIDVLNRLAAPIAWGRRQEFVEQVAAALVDYPQMGPGLVYRIGRALQRNYTIQAQRETEKGDKPRHLAVFRV